MQALNIMWPHGEYVLNSNSKILHDDGGASPNVVNVEEAELTAFHKALTYAQHTSFVSSCFLSDCLSLFNFMLRKNDCIFLRKCMPLAFRGIYMFVNSKSIIIWIPKCLNTSAHCLAAQALSMYYDQAS